MSTANTLLAHLLADLVRSDAGMTLPAIDTLKDEFDQNVEQVLSNYNIEGDARALLMTMDRQLVGEAMRLEFLASPTKLWRPPLTSTQERDPRRFLLSLVADLIRADVGQRIPPISQLVEEFKKTPDKIMEAYGLEPAARDVLRSQNRDAIAEYLFQDLLRTPSPTPTELWTDPFPQITTVEPTQLVATSGQTLKITADCVLSTAEVHLVSDDGFNHFVGVTTTTPPIALTDQVIFATFDLTTALADEYRLLVYLSRSTPPIAYEHFITVTAA